MAATDLSQKQSAGATKIAGAAASGIEDNYLEIDANGDAQTINNNGTGAAAVNVQDGGNSLTVDSPQLPATLGQKTMAASAAVVIASDQSAVPVTVAGVATAANQATEITALGTLDTDIKAAQPRKMQDGAGTALTSTIIGSKQSLDVNITKLVTPTDNSGSGSITAAQPLPGTSVAGGTVAANTNGCSTVTFLVLGTWVATLVIEATVDGADWFIVNGDVDVSDTITTTFTANTFVTIPCGSFSQVRLRASLYTSGTALLTWVASIGSNIQEVFNTTYSGLLATCKLSDGTDSVAVTTNSELKVIDGLRDGGVYGALSIPTANTPVEAKVGASRLTNRKFLQIYVNNNGLFYGLSSSVTTTTGTPLANGQVITFSIDPDSTFQIWLVGNANTKSVQIIETP